MAISIKKAVGAANTLKDYCGEQKTCEDCMLYKLLWAKWETSDSVNHPAHYTQGGIECIDAVEAAVSDLSGIEAVCTGNAIKYLWRWKRKNGIEDLKKARWYINRLIEREKRNDGKRA